jgi:hypothetical protein
MTPTTVWVASSSRSVLPSTPGSPPKRRIQAPWLRITARPLAGRSSSSVKIRPTSGATPSSRKRTGETSTLANTVFSTVPGAPVFVGKAKEYWTKNHAGMGKDINIKGHNALQSTFVFDA